MKIVTDKKQLRQVIPATKVTKEQVDEITEILTTELERHNGYGLSANQLGITNIRACIVNVIEPMVLINPRIVEASNEKLVYAESCLSLPKTIDKPVKTVRHRKVIVETDNLGKIEFSPDFAEDREWKNADEFYNDKGLLECAQARG